jgi:Choline dehydrogenase and related flavoproteins
MSAPATPLSPPTPPSDQRFTTPTVSLGKIAHTYDAIVIGSGMSGGWAAKELCEHGVKTLVLERGRNVEHITHYPTAMLEPWQMPHRGFMPPEFRRENPILTQCYAVEPATQHFFVKDAEHPYEQTKPFSWIRGYHVGGKSLMWARWTQRWSDLDFEANAREGIAVDWPIRYADLAPWYSYVEKFVGISGNRDGLPVVPDGEFLPPMELNCLEQHMKSTIESRWANRHLVISRSANLTQPITGRGACQFRDRCARGCPFGGYFSANSATLPAAAATGNLTLRPDSVVHSIIYDEQKGRATGVRVIDAHTKEMTDYFAKIIFVNAGTINTTLILANSTSSRFPRGLGNDSGQLGHNLMDHNYRVKATATHEGFKDKYYYGRRPTGALLPRFRNVGSDRQKDFLRGYAFSVFGSRGRGNFDASTPPLGAEFKRASTQLGSWGLWMNCMAEHLPHHDNTVKLHPTKKDAWGMPLVVIECQHRENELAMTKDILATAQEMIEAAGFSDIRVWDSQEAPGLGIHEMGTARMGRDPKTSVLNGFNQIHAVKNVFVTDGACMTSSAWQNPSLTYMTLTARAAHYAVEELKKQNL